MKTLILTATILIFSSFAFGQAALNDTGAPDKKAEILGRIREAAGDVQTLAGEFTQERHVDILKKVSVSRGKFYYKAPDSLRWEINQPVIQGFVLKGKKGRRWQGRSGASKSFELKNEPVIQIISDQVFAWAKADFEKLEAEYDIALDGEEPVTLKLTPLSNAEKKYLAHIRLIFSAAENYVSAIEIHEPGGDFTDIKFFDMKINTPLKEDLF